MDNGSADRGHRKIDPCALRQVKMIRQPKGRTINQPDV